MEHQRNLSLICRLCINKFTINKHSNNKYSVTNLQLQEFLSEQYGNFPDMVAEDDAKFPKFICNSCYKKTRNHITAKLKHTRDQSKLPKERRTEYKKYHLSLIFLEKMTSNIKSQIAKYVEMRSHWK